VWVRETLVSKHPLSKPASTASIPREQPPEVHSIIFDSIDARLIRRTAMKTGGAASRLRLDAHAWRRLCTAFKAASNSLCQSLAIVAQRNCSSMVDPATGPQPDFIEGDSIISQEGTTQGDPLGIPMYALATLPLIKKLPTSVEQSWYADDAAATGKIACIRG